MGGECRVMILLQHFIQADRTLVIQIRKYQPRIARVIPYRVLLAQGYRATGSGHIGIVHAAIGKVDRLQFAGAARARVFNATQIVRGVLFGAAYGYFLAQFHACGVVQKLFWNPWGDRKCQILSGRRRVFERE